MLIFQDVTFFPQWFNEDLQISDTGLSLMLAGERITVQWPQVVDSANARASYSSRSGHEVVFLKIRETILKSRFFF